MTIDSPTVNLGFVAQGSVAPAIHAIVERGARLRPELAAEPARIRLRFSEGWPPVLVVLGPHIVVGDNDDSPVDVEIRASLPDLVGLLHTPLRGGIPNPLSAKGRAAIGKVLGGGVEIEGIRTTARRLMQLLSLA